MKRIAVIGAGAAGCFCAIELRRRLPDASVEVFEAGRTPLAKVAITGGGRCNLTNTFRLTTKLPRTSDEYGITICSLLNRNNIETEDITDVIICSVVPNIMHSLQNSIRKYFHILPIIVEAGIRTGIRIATPNPQQVGADRIVDAVAAYELFGGPTLVIDFGTATTMDTVGENGEYFGGCILAGMRTSTDALFKEAAMLPRIDLVRPKSVLGMTTVSQIQAGSVIGYIGATEYLIREARREMPNGDRATVVATGGLAFLIADNTTAIHAVDNDLIIDGLRLLYDQYLEEQKSRAGH